MEITAVFGGSFSPFGNHHLDVVRTLAERDSVSRVFVVPSAAHALKTGKLNYEHRSNMAWLGINELDVGVKDFRKTCDVKVLNIEPKMLRQQRAPIFTVDLLRVLSRSGEFGSGEDHKFRFAVGEDLKDEVKQWDYANEIERDFGFIWIPEIRGVHSTQIRKMVPNRKRWRHLVPKSVAGYIDKHDLYSEEGQ